MGGRIQLALRLPHVEIQTMVTEPLSNSNEFRNGRCSVAIKFAVGVTCLRSHDSVEVRSRGGAARRFNQRGRERPSNHPRHSMDEPSALASLPSARVARYHHDGQMSME